MSLDYMIPHASNGHPRSRPVFGQSYPTRTLPVRNGPLAIAQVAPLYESVPPKLYGGTERIVSYLTEELVARGHDVTLFASGDSSTSARLVPVCDRALRLSGLCEDPLVHHMLLLERVFEQAERFDIIHFHCDYLHFPWSRRHAVPTITTLHGRLDMPDLVPLYREYAEMPLVSISYAQRVPLPWANWRTTIHHGIPREHCAFHPQRGRYLAFLGRVSPEKGLDRAIEIAQRVGMELRIAAKVDPADQEYFEDAIRPLLRLPGVEFLGEIGDREKEAFLGEALALLFPIDWPEPFGLVTVESMACGTPIIAFRRGSVPEVVENGVTGYVVDTVEEAVRALRHVETLSRERCRSRFEERFTAPRMARDYVGAYGDLVRTRGRVRYPSAYRAPQTAAE